MSKKLNIATPKGTASWPKLNTPEYKFDDAGVYTVDLVVSPEVAAEFSGTLTEIANANRDQAYVRGGSGGAPDSAPIKLPISPYLDKDKKETGDMKIRCKMKAFFRDSKTGEDRPNPPTFIDAMKRNIFPAPTVGGGSELILGCQVRLNYVQGMLYVSLAPRVVQILELREGFGTTPDDFGLTEMSGFVSPGESFSDTVPEKGDGSPSF